MKIKLDNAIGYIEQYRKKEKYINDYSKKKRIGGNNQFDQHEEFDIDSSLLK